MLAGAVFFGPCGLSTSVLADEVVALNTAASSEPAGSQPSFVEGEILIKYHEPSVDLETPSGQEISADIMEAQDLVKKEEIDASNIALVTLSDEARSMDEVIAELEQDPRVESAQPNYQYYPTSLPNDPSF